MLVRFNMNELLLVFIKFKIFMFVCNFFLFVNICAFGLNVDSKEKVGKKLAESKKTYNELRRNLKMLNAVFLH